MSQEAETKMPEAKRPKDMTPEEKKAHKKACDKEWRACNTVKARMERAAKRVAEKEAAAAAEPELPRSLRPGYFRAMAAKKYAQQKEDLKHCPLCDCYIVSIRFAKHEITKKHLRMVELQKEGYARDDRLFAEFHRKSRELAGQA